jgi:hypothetical protein
VTQLWAKPFTAAHFGLNLSRSAGEHPVELCLRRWSINDIRSGDAKVCVP